jgi:tyrosine-protein kinase Etk/Wzc
MKADQQIAASNMDFKKFYHKLLGYKTVYIVLFFILIAIAFLINRYAPVKYSNTTTIYLNEQDKTNSLNSPTDMFQSFGLFTNKQNIDNELEMLKSFSLIKKTIIESDLKVTYYSYKNSPLSLLLFKTPFVRKTELYRDSPIQVILDPSVPQAVYMNFNIVFLNQNEFSIEAEGDNIDLYNYIDDQIVSIANAIRFKQRFKFGDEIKTKYFNFRVQKSNYFSKEFTANSNLAFYFNNINVLTLEYQADLKTETVSELSTLIRLTFKGTNIQQVTDFLNNHTSTYLGKSLDKKNNTARSTIDFIDTQISDVADSLSYAESNLKNFRTSQGVMDLSFQGQQVYEQLSKLENERAALVVQQKYYQYLNRSLESGSGFADLVAPTSMNVADPIMSGLVSQIIELNNEKASLLKNASGQQNLYLADINVRLENLKTTIKEMVKNTLDGINISLNEINYRMSKASNQISSMPKTELQLRGIERKFKLNDEIYTFLLQKRSEAQIAKASSTPDYEIVDPALIAVSRRVSPKSLLNYVIAIFLAFLLPTFVLLIKDFINNRITDPEEIEQFTQYPVMGHINHNFHRSVQVVNKYPNSSVTESFRSVRTNFQFFSDGGKRQVLLLTSSTSGEGKTFCAINLATIFALNGHRTILLEYDLRRPKVHAEFNASNIIGISSFLIDKANIEDIIVPTHIENLDFISAGPAAPNPAELIALERSAELIDKLKEIYDYIIIDSAPAGILSETHLLMNHCDLNIYVVRIDKTFREAFKNSIRTIQNNKFSNVSILINDLDVKHDAHKYGYDNKYYTDDKNPGFFRKIFQKKKMAS